VKAESTEKNNSNGNVDGSEDSGDGEYFVQDFLSVSRNSSSCCREFVDSTHVTFVVCNIYTAVKSH